MISFSDMTLHFVLCAFKKKKDEEKDSDRNQDAKTVTLQENLCSFDIPKKHIHGMKDTSKETLFI